MSIFLISSCNTINSQKHELARRILKDKSFLDSLINVSRYHEIGVDSVTVRQNIFKLYKTLYNTKMEFMLDEDIKLNEYELNIPYHAISYCMKTSSVDFSSPVVIDSSPYYCYRFVFYFLENRWVFKFIQIKKCDSFHDQPNPVYN